MHRVRFWQHFVGARLGVDPLIVGVFIWYASSVMEGRLALSRVEARIAYAMRTLGCIVNGLAASTLLGEQLTPKKLVVNRIFCLSVVVVGRN